MEIVFGPVPSRRLGRSLGVNNIPYKVCTYACVYCQIGNTLKMQVERQKFYEPSRIFEEVERRVEDIEKENIKLDYITFVPDGEPTLDLNLEKEVRLLRSLGYPIAIITNSSLIYEQDVRNALLNFDYVSLKIDAITEEMWKRVNRPHKELKLSKILDGILEFKDEYEGKIVTETMLVGGLDYDGELEKMAEFLPDLNPDIAYIAIPTRPPAERWVTQPNEELVAKAYEIFSEKLNRVEYLIGYEGNEFVSLENVREDILKITAVHPMREEAILELLKKGDASEGLLEDMLNKNELKKVEYQGHVYYLRNFRKPQLGKNT